MTQTTVAKGFAGRLAQERRLKAAREHRDVEKQDVAKVLGVSNSTYGRWESGTVPDDTTMQRIADYFGVTPAWLRYGTEPREAAPVYGVREDIPESAPVLLTKAVGEAGARGASRGPAAKASSARRPRRPGGK